MSTTFCALSPNALQYSKAGPDGTSAPTSPLLKISVLSFKSVHPALYVAHGRYPGSWLSPGCLAAHRGSHLVLLHSCPDTVHEALLRKTQTSTLLTRGSPAKPTSEAGYHPCWSGLQVQGTAISPAARKLYNLLNIALHLPFASRILSPASEMLVKYTPKTAGLSRNICLLFLSSFFSIQKRL